jgi:very-short-patch-repair endonuclease
VVSGLGMRMRMPLTSRLVALLKAQSLLPQGRPFTAAEALDRGVTWVTLRRLVSERLLVHPVRGVYALPDLADNLELRLAMLRLVVPHDCVVTDRTAAWLWGATMALAPNDHLRAPPVSVFAPPGRRLRNGLVDSGERRLGVEDVVELGGLLVTSPIRTACDLGRLLHRDQAFAAMDALAALHRFELEELRLEVERFKGYRGVVQLRSLVPWVRDGSQSQAESILRLRWVAEGLPEAECQVEVDGPDGPYFLDIGNREHRLAAEYDGAEFHGEDEREHDEDRRRWMSTNRAWVIVVVRKENLFGRRQDVHLLLRAGHESALRRPLPR